MPCIFAVLLGLASLDKAPSAHAGPLPSKVLPLHERDIADFLAFSPDGKMLAVVVKQWDPEIRDTHYKQEVALFDLAKGTELRRLTGPKGWHANQVLFSPDGRLLAAQGNRGVALWDVGTGKELPLLEYSRDQYEFVCSPDGKQIVGRQLQYRRFDNFRLCVWDVATGKETRTIDHAPLGEIRAFALSGDGEHVLAEHHVLGGRDARGEPQVPWHVTVRVWSVRTGKDLGQVGDVTVWSSSPTPGEKLRSVGAEGWGYPRRDVNGNALHMQPWRGRVGVSASGRAVIFPDYRSANPILDWRISRFILLAHPQTTKPLHDRDDLEGLTGIHFAVLSDNGEQLAATEIEKGGSKLVVWDVKQLARLAHKRTELTDPQRKELWPALTSTDDRRAHDAMRALVLEPEKSVRLLRNELRPVALVKAGEIVRWIADLDDEDFQVREAASQALAKCGATAKAALEKELARTASAEVKRRIEALLEDINQPVSPEELRILRAIDVLEQIGSREAQQLLRTLADGAPEASRTRAAHQSLERLKGRGTNR
jgi:hypothetical protein